MQDIHRSLCRCGVSVLNVGPGTASLVVREGKAGTRADIEGTASCKSAWACPVCAPRLADARARALYPQVVQAMADGFSAFLLTFTCRHKRKMSLSGLMIRLKAAWRALMQSGDYRDWSARFVDKPKWSRGWDMTHGQHGWHPHLHMMLLLPVGAVDADAADLLRFWLKQARLAGLSVTRGAQDVRRLDNPEAVARYAVSPAAVYEALALAKKQGNGGGFTPFQILEGAILDQKSGVSGSKWVALWREYVRTTKGSRLVGTSRNLTLKPDADLALDDERQPVDRPVAFDRVAVRALDRANLMPKLLSVAENEDCPWSRRASCLSFLKAHRISGRFWSLPVVEPCEHQRGGPT